jgi:hypothetical protein
LLSVNSLESLPPSKRAIRNQACRGRESATFLMLARRVERRARWPSNIPGVWARSPQRGLPDDALKMVARSAEKRDQAADKALLFFFHGDSNGTDRG